MFPAAPATPIYGYINGLQPDRVELAHFQAFGTSTISFEQVPRNKFLLITTAVIESNDLGMKGLYYINLGPSKARSDVFLSNAALAIRGNRTSIQQINEPNGLLFILETDQVLKVINEKVSDFTVDVKFRGFLVDQLI